MRKEFIPNWTSKEFEEFVDKIGWFLDELWKEDSEFVGRNIVGKPGPMLKLALEGTWKQLLHVETVFWPVLTEEEEKEDFTELVRDFKA